MRGTGSVLTLFSLGDVLPPPTLTQVRANLRMGIVLRWFAIAMTGVAVMIVARVPDLGVALLTVGIAYNAVVWTVVARAPATSWRRIALVVTIVDQFLLFSSLPIFGSVAPGGEALGAYLIGTIEAITFFGAPGAALSVGIFLGCAVVLQLVDPVAVNQAFNRTGAAGAVLFIGTMSAILVAALRTRFWPAGSPEPLATGNELTPAPVGLAEPASTLSRREQEVLQLVAQGYSNTMIASRLRLSDSTVKSYVENLRLRLNVRNRAEAVAVASRLGLL